MNKTFCQITGGQYHSLAIDKYGKTWGWGAKSYIGLLSLPLAGNVYGVPNPVYGNKTFCQISCFNHSMCIDLRGKVWGWGYNGRGNIGDYTTVSKRTPVSIKGVNKTFCKISTGENTTLGIDFRGKAWGWGASYYYEIGSGSAGVRSTPIAVGGVNKTFCSIEITKNTTMGIDIRGKAWGWGYNDKGQIGDNTITIRATPVAVYGNKTFCKISNGDKHTTGIDLRGKVWSWGLNDLGRLGDYTVISKNTPVAILGVNKTFCQIVGGAQYSLGLDFRGKAWGWGAAQNMQLGYNGINNQSTPVAVYGNRTFCKISSKYQHTMAIDLRGKAWGWGSVNNYGQLGDNTIICKRTPVAVYGTHTFCEINVGFGHSIGIDNNGKTWSWGYNNYDQLGIELYSLTPIQINI